MTIWVNTCDKVRCLSHSLWNAQHAPDHLIQSTVGYKHLKLSQSRPQGLGSCCFLFADTLLPDVTWLDPLFTSCLCSNSPFSDRSLHTVYKLLTTPWSHPSTPYPFLRFYFLHWIQPFLVYHIFYLVSCVPFLILPHSWPPPSIPPLNAKFQEDRDIFVFIFCSLTPAPRVVSGTL